jgi:hypothetical protein
MNAKYALPSVLIIVIAFVLKNSFSKNKRQYNQKLKIIKINSHKITGFCQ